MTKQEFEKLAAYEVSADDYYNVIEPMYMATDLDKREFVKVIDRKKFAIKKTEKLIKVLNVIDKMGSLTTPNGCWRYLVDVEVIRLDIGKGKTIVKKIPNTYRLGYVADYTVYDGQIEVQGN